LRRREGYAVSEDSREYRPTELSTEADGPSPVESHPQNDDHSTGQTEYLKEVTVADVKVEENVDVLSAPDGRMTNRVFVNHPRVEEGERMTECKKQEGHDQEVMKNPFMTEKKLENDPDNEVWMESQSDYRDTHDTAISA
jgi:hypothetical protein